MEELQKILKLIYFSHGLKTEERHCWFEDGRRESVADHIWCMSLMALLLVPRLARRADLEKIFKMTIIHDLVEAEAGGSPFCMAESDEEKAIKKEKEMKAIENIRKMLDSKAGDEIYDLWMEFEARETYESQICTALDKLEANIQHNNSPIHSWTDKDQLRAFQIEKYCQVDPLLHELNLLVEAQSASKLQNAGIDLDKLRQSV